MTLDEYAGEVIGKLRTAYNSKDRPSIEAVFRDADATLSSSNITDASQKKFWASVRAGFVSSPGLLLERQNNSALIALMQAIQKAIAERENK